MKTPRGEAIAQFMKFLNKSEADRATPEVLAVRPPAAESDEPSQEALEALATLTKEG